MMDLTLYMYLVWFGEKSCLRGSSHFWVPSCSTCLRCCEGNCQQSDHWYRGQTTLSDLSFTADILFDTAMKWYTEMSNFLQQRVNIHFCVKMGWTFPAIHHALHTCYNIVLGDRSIHKWIAQFRGGRTLLEDKPRAP